MNEKHSIPIWFFIGSLLLIYGVIILSSNIYEYFYPMVDHVIVLRELNFGVWWGVLLLLVGGVYFISFRPWKKK
jgi:hypothetical protein